MIGLTIVFHHMTQLTKPAPCVPCFHCFAFRLAFVGFIRVSVWRQAIGVDSVKELIIGLLIAVAILLALYAGLEHLAEMFVRDLPDQ